MATSAIYKHSFDFYYKWCQTGSTNLTNVSWSQHYIPLSAGYKITSSWYDMGILSSVGVVSTRHTASISTSDSALAWASPAADLLWNVLVPSMSYSQSTWDDGGDTSWQTYYRATFVSKSFLRTEFFPTAIGAVGVASYPITSSWIAYEPKLIRYASGSGIGVGYRVEGTTAGPFPGTLDNDQYTYRLPSTTTKPTSTYPNVGQNPSTIVYGNNSTGSNDGRFFDLAGGCGITRTSISSSLVRFAASASGTTAGQIASCSVALKQRRLFFPTVSTGSIAFSPSYWVYLMTGKTSNQFFTENGGIYNVKFNLKRDVANGYYPDTADGSELLVFIHNVNAQVPAPSNRVPGATGWYPPEANIVRIKNNPQMAFYNPATGYYIESFNINVIQYGSNAQLVFEASGSLANDGYFGCIIDDVQFCKVGVTTDPGLIQPQTTGYEISQRISNAATS